MPDDRCPDPRGRAEATLAHPSTGEVVGQINAVSAQQAQQAVEAARDAFPAWSALPLETRGKWTLKPAEAISAERDRIAEITRSSAPRGPVGN